MSTYTYYFLDRDGSIPSFEIAESANDDEACDKAPELLRLRPARRAVEVWREDTCLRTFHRAR
jgi:hypothetical protein